MKETVIPNLKCVSLTIEQDMPSAGSSTMYQKFAAGPNRVATIVLEGGGARYTIIATNPEIERRSLA